MKKITIIVTVLILSTTSFCQQTNPSQPLTKTDYLQKSKHQKTAAWILLGGGSALAITGILIDAKKEVSFDNAGTAAIVGGVGVLSMIGSIPLFIASGRNKRKAMAMSASLKLENAPAIQGYKTVHTSYPALLVKINLL